MSIIAALEETRNQTLAFFNLPETELAKTYAPGKWTVKQILHHLADAESVLCERIKRGIAEPQSVVFLFDQDKWNETLNYPEMPLQLSQQQFAATREQIIYLAGKYYDSHGANTFFQAQVGLRTVKEEFDKVVWHSQKHINQVREALASSF